MGQARRVKVRCTDCGQTNGVPDNRTGTVRCSHCGQLFVASTKPRLLPALLIAAGIAGCWTAIVRPWSETSPHPLWIACASAAAFAASIYVPKRVARAESANMTRSTDFGFFRELAVAFGAMTVSALFFAGLDAYLEHIASPSTAAATVERLVDLQRRIDSAFLFLKTNHVLLKASALVLLCGLILLALGQTRALDRLLAVRKRTMQAVKWLTIALISVGSFSLAGSASATGAQAHADAYYFQLQADAKRDVAALRRAVRQHLAERIAEAVVARASPTPPAACANSGSSPSQSCPTDVRTQTAAEIERARELSQDWPATPARYGLSSPPIASASFSAAVSTGAAIDDLEQRVKARTEPPPPASSRELSLQGLGAAARAVAPATPPDAPSEAAVDAAAAAVDAAAPSTNEPGRGGLKALIALAVSMAPELANVELPPQLEQLAGGFGAKLVDALKDSAQSKLEDTVTDVVNDVVSACLSPSACGRRLQARLQAAENDPRVVRLIDRLSEVVRASRGGLAAPALDLRRTDDAAERTMAAAVARLEAAEGEREWSRLLRRWKARVVAPSSDFEPDQQVRWGAFIDDWTSSRDGYAREMMANDQHGSQDDWDIAFLDYLNAHPRRAAIYGYMILNDPEIRPYLVQQQPSAIGHEIGVGSAFLLFASTVHRKPWSDRHSLPEMSMVEGKDFGDGIDIDCPHRRGH